jgi:chromosome segregation ATPase
VSAQDAVDERERQNEQNEIRLDGLRAELDARAEGAAEERKLATKAADDAAAQIERLEGQLETIRTEAGEERERRSELEQRVASLTASEEEVRSSGQRLERELEEAREEVARERETSAELEQRLQALSDAERDARGANERLNGFLENARAEAERQAAARGAAEMQLSELQEAAKTSRSEAKQRGEELLAAERRLTEAREEVEREVRSRAEVEQGFEQERTETERRIGEAARETQEELRQRLEVERQAAELSAAGANADSALAEAEQRLQEAEERVQEAEERAEAEERMRTAIEERLDELVAGVRSDAPPARSGSPRSGRRSPARRPARSLVPEESEEDQHENVPLEQSKGYLTRRSDEELAQTFEGTRRAAWLAEEQDDEQTARHFRALTEAVIEEAARRPKLEASGAGGMFGLRKPNKALSDLVAARAELLERRGGG